ncbi:hypothetical protein V499_08742 [Pseudogymnoascus sp. VKM F-103]|nr:hypothetical protein V499_08742 [Pseudogymnoascus sp. VKM F-103]
MPEVQLYRSASQPSTTRPAIRPPNSSRLASGQSTPPLTTNHAWATAARAFLALRIGGPYLHAFGSGWVASAHYVPAGVIGEDQMSDTTIDPKEFTFDQEVLMAPAYSRIQISPSRARGVVPPSLFNSARNVHEGAESHITSFLFDVVAEKGELWLARNQGDLAEVIGWIWNQHFARLVEQDDLGEHHEPVEQHDTVSLSSRLIPARPPRPTGPILQNTVDLISGLASARPNGLILSPVRDSDPTDVSNKVTLGDFILKRAIELGASPLDALTDIVSYSKNQYSLHFSPTEINISSIQITTLADDVVRAVQDIIESSVLFDP